MEPKSRAWAIATRRMLLGLIRGPAIASDDLQNKIYYLHNPQFLFRDCITRLNPGTITFLLCPFCPQLLQVFCLTVPPSEVLWGCCFLGRPSAHRLLLFLTAFFELLGAMRVTKFLEVIGVKTRSFRDHPSI
jgi:hypothetical protein